MLADKISISEFLNAMDEGYDALASFEACMEAHRQCGGSNWLKLARSAHDWFLGVNDLGLPVGDARIGACHDGLQEHGLNHNLGAESTLAFMQTITGMKAASAVPADEEPQQTEPAVKHHVLADAVMA